MNNTIKSEECDWALKSFVLLTPEQEEVYRSKKGKIAYRYRGGRYDPSDYIVWGIANDKYHSGVWDLFEEMLKLTTRLINTEKVDNFFFEPTEIDMLDHIFSFKKKCQNMLYFLRSGSHYTYCLSKVYPPDFKGIYPPQESVQFIFHVMSENDLAFFKIMLARCIRYILLCEDQMHFWAKNAWIQYAKMLTCAIEWYTQQPHQTGLNFDEFKKEAWAHHATQWRDFEIDRPSSGLRPSFTSSRTKFRFDASKLLDPAEILRKS